MWLLIPFILVILAVVLFVGAAVAVVATAAAVIVAIVHAIPVFVILFAIWLIAKALGGGDSHPARPYARHRSRTDYRPRAGESGLPRQVPVRPAASQSAPSPRPQAPARELP